MWYRWCKTNQQWSLSLPNDSRHHPVYKPKPPDQVWKYPSDSFEAVVRCPFYFWWNYRPEEVGKHLSKSLTVSLKNCISLRPQGEVTSPQNFLFHWKRRRETIWCFWCVAEYMSHLSFKISFAVTNTLSHLLLCESDNQAGWLILFINFSISLFQALLPLGCH